MRDSAGPSASGWTPYGHCTVFACDIVEFSVRPDDVQLRLRQALYSALERSFDDSDVPWDLCYREDRGDGVIIVPPPGHVPVRLVHPLADHLRGALRWYNQHSTKDAQMRLRVALHAGPLHSDANGLVGDTVNHVARLLDAPAFKEEIGVSSAQLGLLVSDRFYRDVIEQGPSAVDPGEFRRIEILVKETRAVGWLHIREPAKPAPRPEPSALSASSALDGGDGSVLAGRWEFRHIDRPDGLFGVFDLRPDKKFTFRLLGRNDAWKTLQAQMILGNVHGEWRESWGDPNRPKIQMKVTDMKSPLMTTMRPIGLLLPPLGRWVQAFASGDWSFEVVRMSTDEFEAEEEDGVRSVWRRLA